MAGLVDGWFASRPRGRNRLIGTKWKRFYSDRLSAWTATPLESHMVPIEMYHVSSNLQIDRLKRDHELESPEKHGTKHRLNETSWETIELRQSSNETQNGETVFQNGGNGGISPNNISIKKRRKTTL